MACCDAGTKIVPTVLKSFVMIYFLTNNVLYDYVLCLKLFHQNIQLRHDGCKDGLSNQNDFWQLLTLAVTGVTSPLHFYIFYGAVLQ